METTLLIQCLDGSRRIWRMAYCLLSPPGDLSIHLRKCCADMTHKNGREAGFTMVELMIVVGIIGIASIIAVPAINEWLARYQLKQAMSEIAGDLNLAKLVAMNRNRQASVTIQLSGTLIEVSGVSSGQQIFPTRTLMPRVTTLPGGAATVNFSSMGLSTAAAPQTIQVQNEKGLTYALSVLPSGKVSWCAKTSCP